MSVVRIKGPLWIFVRVEVLIWTMEEIFWKYWKGFASIWFFTPLFLTFFCTWYWKEVSYLCWTSFLKFRMGKVHVRSRKKSDWRRPWRKVRRCTCCWPFAGGAWLHHGDGMRLHGWRSFGRGTCWPEKWTVEVCRGWSWLLCWEKRDCQILWCIKVISIIDSLSNPHH